jgi:Tol biopolymer transport system component
MQTQRRRRWLALLILAGSLVAASQPALATSEGNNGSIAFVVDPPDGRPHIWKMDADGSHPRRFGPVTARFEPTWSPDGSMVAYWKNEPQQGGSLRIMSADGTWLRTIASFSAVPSELGWSPNGGRIVLAAHVDCYRTLIIDVRSRELVFRSRCLRGQPAWSPDGRRIVYTKLNGDLYTMGRRGGHVRQLTSKTDSVEYAFAPDWAPDGSKIVFAATGKLAGDAEVAVVGRRGGAVTVLTDSPREVRNAVFSPDGKRILFDRCCYGPEQRSWIFSMMSDGTDVTPIRPGYSPDWQPLPR